VSRPARARTAAWLALVTLALGPSLSAVSVQEGRPAPVAAAAPVALQRVVVIGASLSAGYGLRNTPLSATLEASIRTEHAPVQSLADEHFFLTPRASGARQVEGALDAQPTLVVAIDFLFWFGYGALDADGAPVTSEDQRLALLEHGLECLEELDCPLVLGDFPDMSRAVGKMLAENQMPAQETLARLSSRVREWAAKREAPTIVLPLAELVRSLGSEEAIRIGRHAWPAGTRLLQLDDLHPTLEGLTGVAQLVLDELVRRELASASQVDFTLEAVLRRLKESPRRTHGQ